MGASTASNAYRDAYRSAELQTIPQRDLIVRLYQGAERFLNQAQLAIHNRQYEMAHHTCVKAKAIFSELLATLNFELGGEIAQQLKALYLFLIVEITEANLRKDAQRIAALLPIVATLREAWQEIPDSEAHISGLPAHFEGNGFSARG
jgi:flagellar protein FliS